MLEEDVKQEIRTGLDLIKQSMPGFRSRPGQLVMIAEVAKVLARCPDPVADGKEMVRAAPGTTIACISGGTGIGKSLGYALAGISIARRKRKKLVISTSSINLQEQLVARDLPMFFNAAKVNAKIEIAKGRTRYVCGYRLLQAASDMSQATMFGREERAKGASDANEVALKMVDTMVKACNDGSWNGDRDNWPGGVDDTFWSAITTDRNGCLGNNCPSFRACAQAAARKRIKDADVIVANHDLVLADLAMGGKIIAKPEDVFYIFDESHHLPDRAVSAFATSHFVGAGQRLAERIEHFATTLSQALGPEWAVPAKSLASLAERLGDNLDEAFGYFSALAQLKPTESCPRPTLEFEMSCVPEEFHTLGANIKTLAGDIANQLDAATDALAARLGTDKVKQPLYEKLLADAGFHIGKTQEIADTWELFLEEPALDQPPIAKWIEASRFKGQTDYQMCASPVLAGGYLRNLLWERAAGVVLTSATLTSLGNFDDFLRRSGLSTYGDSVTCVHLPSPFNYSAQGTLEIAKMTSSPKDYDAHTLEITGRISGIIAAAVNEGTLVLFTSRRQMEDVANRIAAPHSERILMQGQLTKAEIICEHKKRIDRGESSVIFGLASFSEGVDLVDRYCTHVVIAKLAFQVPDDPVLRTLSNWVTRRGGNPFMEISVPDTARKLEQSIGRLIRTEADRGQITIFDPRLWDTRFGKAILRGLPPFRLIAKGREVYL
jgi:ATP-dependent DNA helicase DinG